MQNVVEALLANHQGKPVRLSLLVAGHWVTGELVAAKQWLEGVEPLAGRLPVLMGFLCLRDAYQQRDGKDTSLGWFTVPIETIAALAVTPERAPFARHESQSFGQDSY